MMKWLLPQTEAERIRAIDEAVISSASMFAGLDVTSGPEPMSMAYGTASIKVRGMLVKERDAILDYYGIAHTAYSEITAQVREAEDKGAKRGAIHFDSPGGQVVSDLYDAMDAIANSSIEWRATFGDMLASAAYMIASQAQKGIYATSEMSMAGSIGVAATVYTSMYRKDIANTDSPNKRPDANTEEGISAIQQELDDIYGVLAEKMASGRGVSVDTIKNDYGKGGVFTARTAIKMKIIDGMESPRTKQKTAATQQADGGKMDIETLKKEHPAVYQAAVNDGVAKERKRTDAHCKLAKRYGTSSIAIDDIMAEGKEADVEVLASHQDEANKKQKIADHGSESPGDTGTCAAAKTAPTAANTKSEVQSKFNQAFGADGWDLTIGG